MKNFRILAICLLLAIAPLCSFAQAGKVAGFFGKKLGKTAAKVTGKEVVEKTAKEVAEDFAVKAISKNSASALTKSAAKKELSEKAVRTMIERSGGKIFLKEGAENIIRRGVVECISKKAAKESAEMATLQLTKRNSVEFFESYVKNNIKSAPKRVIAKKAVKEESQAVLIKQISKGSTSEKAQALSKLKSQFDNFKGSPAAKQEKFNRLPPNVQNALDRLWSKDRLPDKGGKWLGEKGNSLWKPNAGDIPKNKGYSNKQNKNWGDILKEHGYEDGIQFVNGNPQFKAVESVKIKYPDLPSNFNKMSNSQRKNYLQRQRNYVQEQAFEALAKQKGTTKEAMYQFKNSNNLVWHELPDCETLILVPREIHDAIAHSGGISMFGVLSSCL